MQTCVRMYMRDRERERDTVISRIKQRSVALTKSCFVPRLRPGTHYPHVT